MLINNEQIDIRIKDRNFIRVGNYKSYREKILWRCGVDSYEWLQSPESIFHKTKSTGCPKCAGNAKHTNNDVDLFLKDTHIRRIGPYINNTKTIDFYCTTHKRNFKSSYSNIKSKIKKGTGCPECSTEKMRLSNSIIDSRLNGRGIKRIGDYITANEKIEWELSDGYRWFSTPANILTKIKIETHTKRLSNDIIDQRLADRDIKRISDYVPQSNSRLRFLCLKCEYEWETSVSGVLVSKSGCPGCSCGVNETVFKDFITKSLKYEYFKQHKLFIINNKSIRPDFYLEVNNRKIIIEYNGIQHYKPIKYFGGIARFQKQQDRDKMLRVYCKDNNIELYEIPYYINNEVSKQKLLELIGGRQIP